MFFADFVVLVLCGGSYAEFVQSLDGGSTRSMYALWLVLDEPALAPGGSLERSHGPRDISVLEGLIDWTCFFYPPSDGKNEA